jgi:hypothetical protein
MSQCASELVVVSDIGGLPLCGTPLAQCLIIAMHKLINEPKLLQTYDIALQRTCQITSSSVGVMRCLQVQVV